MEENLKELLLKDLSGRITYGVKVHCKWNLFQGSRISEDGELVSINTYAKSIHFKRNSGRVTEIPFNRIDGTVLPYLHPMSSMTRQECTQLNVLLPRYFIVTPECLACLDHINGGIINFEVLDTIIDFYNSHHLDWRGLIPKGLALEASKDMYKF